MQRAVVFLLLAGVAAGESGSSRDGKSETSSETAAPMQKQSAGMMPFESVWHRYLPKDATEDFAGDAFPGQSGQWFPDVKNTSDPKSWRDAFMKAYAKSYLHFAHADDSLPAGPERARDAQNITDLKKWKARQEAAIKGFVPKEFQDVAKKGIEKRFEQRASEIKAAQNATANSTVEQSDSAAAAPAFLLAGVAGGRPMKAQAEADAEPYVAQHLPHVASPASPMAWRQAFMQEFASSYMQLLDAEDRVAKEHRDAPAHAEDCRTISELRAWRDAKEARVKAFVPKEYQSLAEGDVKRKYERREAAIQDEAAEQKKQEEEQRQKPRNHQDGQAAAEKPEHEDAKAESSKADAKQEEGTKPKHEDAKAESSTADGKQDASEAGGKEEGTKPNHEDAKAESSTADAKQDASEASEEASGKPQSNATLLAADSTLLAALPMHPIPLLALAFLLASLTTGALVARARLQRTPDMGSSYLLVTEA